MENRLIQESFNIKAVSDLSEADWQTAVKRFQIIEPLLNNEPGVTADLVADHAGIGRMTVFRWLKRYKEARSVMALADQPNDRGKGNSLLDPEVEDIIRSIIDKRYLNKQKLNATKITLDITIACRQSGLKEPHYLTVLNRINQVTAEQKLARRQHFTAARNKYEPNQGSFPDADYPLAAVQIDHTLLDILVVDELYRQPVGRPWITLAIDVYSRMVVGFYISLDPPGALGTGLCLSHAILAKELWLTDLDVKGSWPCSGLMRSIYLDNAKEFHGLMLERACQEYGIEINFRPVTKPHYGGHIERLLGTILGELHALPGTTFSNIKDRRYYDPEGKACFTLKELEQWLATFIVGVYHQREHTALRETPLARYNAGISGSGQIGTGKFEIPTDELKVRLDFMPFVERSVQRYGVSIDSIAYYGDVLRKWINSYEDPNARYKVKRKFAFKRDPRDISSIYFFDPELQSYFQIPYRNTAHPAITIWEHKKIMRVLKQRGVALIDEDMIFSTYEELRRMETEAVGNAAAARRRRSQTRKQYATSSSIKQLFQEEPTADVSAAKVDFTKKYLPFEDIEG
jgi:putative transposase